MSADSQPWGAGAISHAFRARFALVVGTALLAGCGDDVLRPNTPPTAAFTAACSGLTCTLTDESTDDDGSIEAYAWDFGDGEVGTEQHPSHTYDPPGGQFNVTLSVTDDAGDAATTTRQVTVQPDESVPVKASFVFACTVLTCTFTDRSSGPVVARAWDFGDGEASDQQNPNHTYAEPGGRFNVTLRVMDDQGAESTVAKEVEARSVEMRDLSGTYERVTIHDSPDRNSRIEIREDGTFELFDWTGTDTLAYPGRWRSVDFWLNMALEPGTAIGLDFDAIAADEFCGEAFGVFLRDSDLAIAFCRPPIEAGLQEGVYSSAPSTGTSLPPPQGGQIAFVRDGRIQRANTDGSGLVQLTEGPGDGAPAWSPDGSRIAFSRSGGDAPGVYVVNVDGSNATRLAGAGAESGDPAWSPDGEWIVFVCGPPIQPDPYELCKVGTDGAGTVPVRFTPSLTGQVSSPSWSPDGARIAFTSDWAFFDILFDIWSIAPDGTQMTALTTHTPGAPNPFEFRHPAWSPDGQRIAYVKCPWAWNECSSSAVSVMNADGTDMTFLVAASGHAAPTWSPDGQLIAFASGGSIEWVSADGSQRGLIVDDGHSPSWRR